MVIATNILVFLHILGAVMVVGIWIANFKKGITVPGQFHAALLQLITGFALYFMMMSHLPEESATRFHMFIGIKMLLALIIAVAAYLGQKKYKRAHVFDRRDGVEARGHDDHAGRNVALAHTVGGLGLVNIAIAVFGL
ncbi:hypothetical protein VVR12_03785 [Rothia sp. LK2588]|uniref:hypothetical protein n=1 Tax=Rothia sp. LK2588 TaxID=3114369 RepID=UPI0034CE003B